MKARQLFLWQAFDAQGALRRGELMSEEKRQVSRLLIEQGLQPYRIGHGKRVTPGQWRGEPLIHFTRQLATLLQAGLPLVNALQLLAAEHPSAAWSACCASWPTRCAKGNRFPKPSPNNRGFFP
ncbi:hypothetical protein PTT72_18285 [Serratia ureilytica]|uniref:type II secretion system F family protein n=1 Tax=Serratia ureilytica TaxID=300181 RepID=UPI00313B5614